MMLVGCARVRVDRVIAEGWKFTRSDVADAKAPAFGDGQWQAVTLPHTWNARDGPAGGSPGVYLKPVHVDEHSAEVEVTAKLTGPGNFVTRVFDASGRVVAESDSSRVRIDRPHLWDGVRDPYLYRVEVAVKDGATIT